MNPEIKADPGCIGMEFSNWTNRLKLFAKQINTMNGVVQNFYIGEKAEEEEVQRGEAEMGFRIPEGFRTVLKEYAKSIDVFWRFDESIETKLPEPFKNKVSSGWCHWDLNELIEINRSKNELVQYCFIDLDVPGSDKLLNTLAFLAVGNGDYLLIDMNKPGEPVIYLSHEMDKMHGCKLGNSFVDFVEKWTLIGCVGPEDWQFEPFIKAKCVGIEADSPTAMRFREFAGFDLNKLEEAKALGSEQLITPKSGKEWFHSLLGDTWERKYEIEIEEIATGQQSKSVIPAINGASFNGAEYKYNVEKHGTHRLISFKETINPNVKKNDS